MPEPAVTNFMPANAWPINIKSALLSASTTATPTPSARNAAKRARMASASRATTSCASKPSAIASLQPRNHAHPRDHNFLPRE